MKRILQDERTIQETYKQNSLGFKLLYFGILLDLLYKQFILQESISAYWDLALLFFGVSFILTVKRIRSGLLTNKLDLKRPILSSIIAAVIFSITNFVWLDNKSPIKLIISGILFCIVFYGINLLMQYFSSKKNDDMLKEN